jgi:threonine dehydrogenase-like Zn-dependent dehydrogenase
VIFASDPHKLRREKAIQLGAVVVNPVATDPGVFTKRLEKRGVDFAIECSGVSKALHTAIKACGIGGRVVTIATYRSGSDELYLGEEWHRNRITLVSSMSVNGCPHRASPLWDISRLNITAWNLLKEGDVEVESLITHEFDIKDAQKAYELIDKKSEETLKVIFKY